MTFLKITDGILNKKNENNCLKNSCNDNHFFQNDRRYLKQKELDQ